MERRVFSAHDRVALARAWVEARAHGESQTAFAARVGVDARRIRQFAREYGAPQAPVEAARRIVGDAVEQLQRLMQSIDANQEALQAALVNPLPATDAAAEAARLPALVELTPAPEQEQHRRGRADAASVDAGVAAQTTANTNFQINLGAPIGAADCIVSERAGRADKERRKNLFDLINESE